MHFLPKMQPSYTVLLLIRKGGKKYIAHPVLVLLPFYVLFQAKP